MFTEYDARRASDIYRALPEYARRIERITSAAQHLDERAARGLTAFEYQLFSQNGEDGVLAEILRRIGTVNAVFVEFGIEQGKEGNCIALADIAGWSGLFMEANPALFGYLASKYRPNPAVQTVQTMVTPDNILSLLASAGIPSEPDVMSIDVDGADFWIWSALEPVRPRIVIIEYNSAIDQDTAVTQPLDGSAWQGTDYFGSSLAALELLAARRGYRLVHCDLAGVNAFFVRSELCRDLPERSDVIRRGPNYFLSSIGHPADTTGRTYLDVEPGPESPSS
jgi:hypothetical protein